MKKHQLIALGATVVIAIILIIRFLLFLHPKSGDGGTKLHVRFQNIDKISQGSKVTFAGKPVGEVEKILIMQNSLNNRPIDQSIVYPYELILAIDSSIKIYQTDVITVKTAGLLGERFIAIIPQPTQGQKLIPISPTDVVYAYEPASMEDAFKDFAQVTKKAESTFESVLTLIPELTSAAREANQILRNINQGQGTISQLIKNPQLHDETVQCLRKVDFFVDSISSYGLFFHTQPAWQREQKTRNILSQNESSGSGKMKQILAELQNLQLSIESQPQSELAQKELSHFVKNLYKQASELEDATAPKNQ